MTASNNTASSDVVSQDDPAEKGESSSVHEDKPLAFDETLGLESIEKNSVSCPRKETGRMVVRLMWKGERFPA